MVAHRPQSSSRSQSSPQSSSTAGTPDTGRTPTDRASETVHLAIDLLADGAQAGDVAAAHTLWLVLQPLVEKLAFAQVKRLQAGDILESEDLRQEAYVGMRLALSRWQRQDHFLKYGATATKWHLVRACLRARGQSGLPEESEVDERD